MDTQGMDMDRQLVEPLHYEGWSDDRIRAQHVSIYGSHYAAHAATCGPCVRATPDHATEESEREFQLTRDPFLGE